MRSSNRAPLSRLLTDARLFPVIGAVPYLVLAALAVFTFVIRHTQPHILLIDLALCAALAAWMLGMFTLRRDSWGSPVNTGVFLAGFVGLLAVMVIREPWFGLLAIAGYLYSFGLLRWPWRLLGVAAVAILAGMAQASGVPRNTAIGLTAFVAIIVVNIVVMCGYCWIQWTSDVLAAERSRALDEVRQANSLLGASLAENAALQEQLVAGARQGGVQDERARMAREIHDTLAQGLIGIITQLEAADLASADPDERRRHFEAAATLARESLREARRSVLALRPEALEGARLGDALADVTHRWSERQGIPVQLTTTGTIESVASEAEVALLRAAQEALANVAKHAGADRVGVTLSYLEREVALDVRDDGRGFDVENVDAASGTGGFGLTALRERVEGLHGSVAIESEPGRGTAVSVRVPVRAGVSE